MSSGLLSRIATQARQGDRGALTLGYVAVLPFVFLLIMVIIQASFWFLAREAALAAAREGADAARAFGASQAAGATAALAFARESASGYLEHPAVSSVGSTARTVSVTVTGLAPSLVPGLVVAVSETVEAPVEEFRP